MTSKRTGFLLFLLTALAPACGDSPRMTPSATRYDAAHSVAADALIEKGSLVSPTTDATAIQTAIRQQLMYTIGQFNGYNGGSPDMRRTEITVKTIVQRSDGYFDVTYAAKMLVAWPREYQIPAALTLVLPARGDSAGLETFLAAYGADESTTKLCLANEAHGVTTGLHWYYYRPLKQGCPLLIPSVDSPDQVARFDVRLTRSAENTDGKAPEYQKVWEDKRLVVTAIFGKYEADAVASSDAGIAAYREMYSDLIKVYGQPFQSTLGPNVLPDASHPDVRASFNTISGPLDIALFLVGSIQTVDAAFQATYNQRTVFSDFVSYNGHSGLGANIRALAAMGQFVQGQYQLFMVNGCDTFAYVDDALRDAHVAANPNEGVNRYFDMITNAMPSYFYQNAHANMAVIEGLVNKQKTYRQILASFDQSQRAGVTGEEDNRWPLPF